MRALTKQHQIFAAAVASGKTQSDAYRLAYPRSKDWNPKALHTRASLVASYEGVARRIDELRSKAVKKYEVSVERIIQERARLAFFDPRKLFNDDGTPKRICDLDEDTAAAISGLDVVSSGNDEIGVGQILKYKLAAKNDSLAALEKINGMYRDSGEGEGVFNIQINMHCDAQPSVTINAVGNK